MAVGLGVTPEEWEELRGNIDDSFWVMRIIGSSIVPPPTWLRVKSMTQGILNYPMVTTESRVVHTSMFYFFPSLVIPLIVYAILRDYGCLTYEFSLASSLFHGLNAV